MCNSLRQSLNLCIGEETVCNSLRQTLNICIGEETVLLNSPRQSLNISTW